MAVACERDLTSGIQDSYPIPVIGVLNERPFGPCRNTRVDLAAVGERHRLLPGPAAPRGAGACRPAERRARPGWLCGGKSGKHPGS